MSWNTDTVDFGRAVAEFERHLPGFWWVVRQGSDGAKASCAIDQGGNRGPDTVVRSFHSKTPGLTPAEAVREVMEEALAYIEKTKGERS